MSRGTGQGVARVRARVEGRVQGVGFRPAVYRHAVACGLTGFVRNDPQGVTLEVEGDEGQLSDFFDHLVERVPRHASITRVTSDRMAPRGYGSFEVVASEVEGAVGVHLPPDLATCATCLAELRDPGDRRYRYPFINCVDCGPRLTIIRGLPYDRTNTSMAQFTLCPACEREYRDPSDRRFHAEPNACADCGPRLSLIDREGTLLAEAEQALLATQALLNKGGILAVKGLGGYHLACDAFNEEAIGLLRSRKQRPDKALAVMFRDLATLRKYLAISPLEVGELVSTAHPIVVVEGWINPAISPDTRDTGVFLPYTPIHHLLLEAFEGLVLTSGNRREEPIATDEGQVLSLLADGIADAALTHDRPIQHRCDDSVLRIVDGSRQFMRRARGFVPSPLRIARDSPAVLATGGELKTTFCLAVRGEAHVSQHIGDLADFATYSFYQEEIGRWLELLRVSPQLVAHDLHPGYLSSRYASGLEGVSLVGVQHHHAHVVSVMAECDLEGPVLGVALDGTGFGPDGTVWGGEFLLADRRDFKRLAHFKTYPLPGGEKAIEEPWRMAASVCAAEGISLPSEVRVEGLGRSRLEWARDGRAETIRRLISSALNCPLTSSAGRLFDAAAALLGLCDLAGYEAQGAIRLETAADPAASGSYRFIIRDGDEPWILDLGLTFGEVVGDINQGVEVGTIAARFHNTVAAAAASTAVRLCAVHAVTDVVLSGGVFQNKLLLRRAIEALRASGLSVHINTKVPPNDGGISLGQAAVAVARAMGDARCA